MLDRQLIIFTFCDLATIIYNVLLAFLRNVNYFLKINTFIKVA